MPLIPGVLVLNGNKTYGKIKKRFLYKCIPDDRRIPEFLIPYTIKSNFNKVNKNIYHLTVIVSYCVAKEQYKWSFFFWLDLV